MRKLGPILLSVMLLLSLGGNLRQWQERNALRRSLQEKEQTIADLQVQVKDRENSLEQVRQDREYLRQRVRDLGAANQQLEASLNACQGSEDLLEKLDRLEAETRALRRLVPTEPVERAFLSPEELRQHLEEIFVREYSPEEAATDLQVLHLLELLPPGTDLYTLLLDLYSEQVAGFYDAETGQLYVVGEDLGPLETLTFVHEYVHALQDQAFDLGEQLDAVEDDGDRSLALQALAEGDASLAMQQYLLDHIEDLYTPELISDVLGTESAQFDQAPAVIQAMLLFPYEEGLTFVLSRYEKFGWAGVDETWGDPPQSSEQILHPERYPADAPVLVTLPALTTTLGTGWRMRQEDTLGEFMLRQHLATRLDEETVGEAATGWGGDQYAFFVNEERGEVLLALLLYWDDEEEADEFVRAYQTYAEERYGPVGEGGREEGLWWAGRPGLFLQQDEERVRLVYAPSEEVARSVARRLR